MERTSRIRYKTQIVLKRNKMKTHLYNPYKRSNTACNFNSSRIDSSMIMTNPADVTCKTCMSTSLYIDSLNKHLAKFGTKVTNRFRINEELSMLRTVSVKNC